MKRNAFTLIELIFVVVIVSILAFVALGRFGTTGELQQATDQLIRHLRYTQHLAMMDDHFDPGDGQWYKRGWQLMIHTNGYDDLTGFGYSIYQDRNGNRAMETTEFAVDPMDQNLWMSVGLPGWALTPTNEDRLNPQLSLAQSFNIINISRTGMGTSTRISFDSLGKPYTTYIAANAIPLVNANPIAQRTWLMAPAQITLTHADGTCARIQIEPVTGYVHQVAAPNPCP